MAFEPINRVRRGTGSHRDACVAQLAEQLTRNEQVAGSNPATSSRLLADDARSFSMCKSSDKRYTLPMKNAEASVRMEGCQVLGEAIR